MVINTHLLRVAMTHILFNCWRINIDVILMKAEEAILVNFPVHVEVTHAYWLICNLIG